MEVLDTTQIYGIMSIEKGAADRRLAPVSYKEVTAWLGSLGRLLLFCNLNNQTGQADKYKTKLKQLIISYHTDHPLPLGTGGKEGSPPVRGGSNRLPFLAAPGSNGTIDIVSKYDMEVKTYFR